MTDRKSTSQQQLQSSAGLRGKTSSVGRSPYGSARHDPRPGQQSARRQARIFAAAYILDAITRSGKSQAQVAAELGVTPSRINNLINIRDEDDTAAVPLPFLFEIADITNVPLSIYKAPRKKPVAAPPRRPIDVN